MSGRGKPLSPGKIGEIAAMVKAGMRPKVIISATNLPKSTVYDLLEKVDAGTHFEVKKKTEDISRNDRAIVREVKRSRRVSCSDIKDNLQLRNLSVRTIQRRIVESGEFKSGYTRKCAYLNETNRGIRVAWALDPCSMEKSFMVGRVSVRPSF